MEYVRQLHPTQDQPAPPGGFGNNPRIGVATTRAPAASREDSYPQAILKFHCPFSMDYRARYGLPVAAHLSIIDFHGQTQLDTP